MGLSLLQDVLPFLIGRRPVGGCSYSPDISYSVRDAT